MVSRLFMVWLILLIAISLSIGGARVLFRGQWHVVDTLSYDRIRIQMVDYPEYPFTVAAGDWSQARVGLFPRSFCGYYP